MAATTSHRSRRRNSLSTCRGWGGVMWAGMGKGGRCDSELAGWKGEPRTAEECAGVQPHWGRTMRQREVDGRARAGSHWRRAAPFLDCFFFYYYIPPIRASSPPVTRLATSPHRAHLFHHVVAQHKVLYSVGVGHDTEAEQVHDQPDCGTGGQGGQAEQVCDQPDCSGATRWGRPEPLRSRAGAVRRPGGPHALHGQPPPTSQAARREAGAHAAMPCRQTRMTAAQPHPCARCNAVSHPCWQRGCPLRMAPQPLAPPPPAAAAGTRDHQ